MDRAPSGPYSSSRCWKSEYVSELSKTSPRAVPRPARLTSRRLGTRHVLLAEWVPGVAVHLRGVRDEGRHDHERGHQADPPADGAAPDVRRPRAQGAGGDLHDLSYPHALAFLRSVRAGPPTAARPASAPRAPAPEPAVAAAPGPGRRALRAASPRSRPGSRAPRSPPARTARPRTPGCRRRGRDVRSEERRVGKEC